VLQHAIGENSLEDVFRKRQKAAVGYEKECVNAHLPTNAFGGPDSLERGIDADRAITRAGGGDAPPSPTTPNFKKRLAISWRHA
jgi:hypothetical protein